MGYFIVIWWHFLQCLGVIIGRKWPWHKLSIVSEYPWGTERKHTHTQNPRSQDIWCDDRHSNSAPYEYRCTALELQNRIVLMFLSSVVFGTASAQMNEKLPEPGVLHVGASDAFLLWEKESEREEGASFIGFKMPTAAPNPIQRHWGVFLRSVACWDSLCADGGRLCASVAYALHTHCNMKKACVSACDVQFVCSSGCGNPNV
jgi:hypothetical protein